MAQLQVVFTNSAPEPLPQFSQAVKHNGMVYCSGNIGIAPSTAKLVGGTVKDRTASLLRMLISTSVCPDADTNQRQALRNLSVILEASGSGLQNVVKMNIFLTSMENFAMMNEAYDEFFVWETKPVNSPSDTWLFLADAKESRTCVAVYQLPFGTDVEIECIAFASK